eukprot:4118675-Lingulodinium_polyedra.AAC.1
MASGEGDQGMAETSRGESQAAAKPDLELVSGQAGGAAEGGPELQPQGCRVSSSSSQEEHRCKLDQRVAQAHREACQKWAGHAAAGEWDHVKPPLSIYMSLDGQAVREDPRRRKAYRDQLVSALQLDGDDKEG